MTYEEFSQRILEVESLADGEYLSGYRKGIRRRYHGEGFGTAEEHAKFISMDADGPHRDFARGYRDGFACKVLTTPDEASS